MPFRGPAEIFGREDSVAQHSDHAQRLRLVRGLTRYLPFGATPRPDGLTADGAQNRMLRTSEMAVRQRSQMPLMVRQISLCPGLASPGLAALPSWGK